MRKIALICAALASLASTAQSAIDYSGSATAVGSTGDFAPYFIGSMNGGRTVRSSEALADIRAEVALNRSRRFSWGAGAEFIGGYSSANTYERYDAATASWTTQQNRPSAAWIQQLYGQVKYRGVLLEVGQKDASSALLDERLSSGDLTRSGNARGIPGASLGFIDFQDIPFTRGWVQIDGVVTYGKFTDSNYMRRQYNYYNWVLATDTYYTYKRCYFRTKPSEAFSVTLGMQTAGQFGGVSAWYRRGQNYKTEARGFRIKDAFKMLLPTQGNGNNFYEGNTLGSWDFKARYRLADGRSISFAFEWPWEDGSGIGRRNGWDGLWGLYYHARPADRAIITGAAVEYLDFTNQSGPIHWAPGDMPGTDMTSPTTGGDNYYNNDTYTAYANYGMAIATPFLVAPIYNLNGYPAFQHNCARGFHAAVTGCLGADFDYTLKYSYQKAWGVGRHPQPYCRLDNSMMADVRWNARALMPGLSARATAAFDAGRLRGNNFGVLVGITYTGSFNFKKK